MHLSQATSGTARAWPFDKLSTWSAIQYCQHSRSERSSILNTTDDMRKQREVRESAARENEFRLEEATIDELHQAIRSGPVSYTHLRAHETGRNLVCRLLLE